MCVTSPLQSKGSDDMFPGVDVPLTLILFPSSLNSSEGEHLDTYSKLQENIHAALLSGDLPNRFIKPINMHVYGFVALLNSHAEYTYTHICLHTHKHTHTHTHT